MSAVLILGEGIAGSCCSRLLGEAGVAIAIEALRRPKLPAIMLGETTQKLLSDVFNREDLFTGFPRISKRVVLWGPKAEAVTLPHSAVVVSEKELLDRIHSGYEVRETAKPDSPDWTVFASSPLPPSATEHHFGSRLANASAVTLEKSTHAESCWIESLENGWLFLLPAPNHSGWLLSVGDSAEALLAASQLIRKQIADFRPSPGTFPSHPRAAFPLAAPGWLACGTAALGFDPLCGDGAGNAVREAILGSAAIRAAMSAGDAEGVAAHYQTRLLGGFKRHVGLCYEFYNSGRSGSWWDQQLDDLNRGLSWCSEHLAGIHGASYRLNGFTLESVK
jgi:hypothetical protein